MGIGDLYPTAQLYWNSGVNNWMTYVTGDIPVGDYDFDRLANLGIGHGAIDFGGAYTYLNTKSGWEFSGTAGITFNFENQSTDYTNGIDAHFDWGASKFLSEKFFIGAVGYAYQQLTPDKGQPAILGNMELRSFAVGPQLGYNCMRAGCPSTPTSEAISSSTPRTGWKGQAAYLTINLPLSQLAGEQRSGDKVTKMIGSKRP